MKIAIDALGIHDYGGGRTATMNLLESLIDLDRENNYRVYLSKSEPTLAQKNGNIEQVIAPFRNRFLMRMWAQSILPFHVKDFDLVHFAKNLCVYGVPIPYVVTMYDMTTLVHAELFPWTDVWYWKNIEKSHLQQAAQVISISENTKKELMEYYNLQPEKIRVIYPSIDPRFRVVSEEETQNVREKYNLPDSYVLHVGRIDRKKNLTLLVEAFARARAELNGQLELKLVLVGHVYYKSQDNELLPMIDQLGLSSDVLFTGRLPDEDLPAVYSGSCATVFPSLHEGFGLVAVEALACGAPLITHRAGAVLEVVGDAAYMIDQVDVEHLSSAIVDIGNNPKLRGELRQRGVERAKRYHRIKNGLETLKLYSEVVMS
jgi:glycosyltransferase involved in cell wall biosynthesis